MPSVKVYVVFQYIISISGIIGNILFVATIFWRSFKSKLTNFLLGSQCILDAFALLVYLLVKFAPPYTQSSSIIFDSIVCYVWTSQVTFWFFIMASVQTLVWLALDRYIAVLMPIHYNRYPKKLLLASIIWIYTISVILVFPTALDRNFVNRTCLATSMLSEHYYNIHIKIYSLAWYCFTYFMPVLWFIVIYSKIILAIRSKVSVQKSSDSDKTRKSTMMITITTITVTVQFVLLVFLDASYYVAGAFGIVEYVYFGSTQEVGILLLSLSACVNPLIYMITLKTRRNMCINLYCPYIKCFRPKIAQATETVI